MGSTFASTAILSYELDEQLADLVPRLGEADARRVYELSCSAIGTLGDVSAAVGGGVGFNRRHEFYFARNDEDATDRRREFEMRHALGFRIALLTRNEIESLFPFSRPLATRSSEAAEVDPVRFTRALLNRAAGGGVRIFTDTVTTYAPGNAVELATESGGEIQARHVVFATGYETKRFADIPGAKLTSTYVVATEPLAATPGWPEGAVICEAGNPYSYMRKTDDGRLLYGGEDEPFADPAAMRAALPAKVNLMAERLQAMFPELRFRVDAAWAAVFSSTVDGLPFIGPHPDFPGASFALGYGGNGITFAAIATDILTDQILGRDTPDARLFRFGRSAGTDEEA